MKQEDTEIWKMWRLMLGSMVKGALLNLVRRGRVEESREGGDEIERNISSPRTDIFGGFG